MNGYIKNPTQEQRILEILKAAQKDLIGGWVSGMFFLSDMRITQYHARIWGLQKKGYKIKGEFIPGKNWKQYKLISNPQPLKLFQHENLQHTGA